MRSMLIAAVSATLASSALGYTPRGYYIGIDGRPDQTGALINHTNPNHGRLTLLFSHVYPNTWSDLPFSSNHFHRIGAYAHVVPPGFNANNPVPAGQSLNTFFTNARIPESNYPNIKLIDGTGVFAGKFISSDRPEQLDDRSTEYDDITFRSIHEMLPHAGPDTGSQATAPNSVNALYYSSRFGANNTPRYTGSLDDITIGLVLVSKSAGLNIADGSGNTVLSNPGDVFNIGPANSAGFDPVFWVDGSAAPLSSYSATLKLVDLDPNGGITPESGEFRIDFSVIPEPASLSLLALGGLTMLRRRRA